MTYSIIGGDGRMIRLAEMLRRDGHTVSLCGFENYGEYVPCVSAGDALQSERIILPLPTTKDKCTVFAPFGKHQILLSDIKSGVKKASRVFTAGYSFSLPNETDYFKKEDFTLLNAVLTAEGAVGAAVNGSERALFLSNALVVGYGRIGTALCDRLKGFGCDITATYRKEETKAQILSDGITPLSSEKLEDNIERFDFIFNTAPAQIISDIALAKIKSGATLIELASAPFGFCEETARKLGINTLICSGLPAKVSPHSAAHIIYTAVNDTKKGE